jgi:hypothetical protein
LDLGRFQRKLEEAASARSGRKSQGISRIVESPYFGETSNDI